jgi:hypothetical protein
MSKSTKQISTEDGAPDEATGATCVLCHTHVSPIDMAVLTCAMPPNAHESSVHVACAEEYGAIEATNFLKTERLFVICPKLGGGGASPNLVSNSVLKELGLQDMLDGTGAEKRKGSLTTTNGKMSDKYLKMAKKWANDRNIDKKLLLAACPHDGCKLTIEKCTLPQQNDLGAAAYEQPSAAPRKRHLLAIMASNGEADEGRCVGTKSDGTQCPRSVTESGGDVNAGVCRNCKAKADKLSALAAAAAAAEAEVAQGGTKRASTVGASTKMTSKRESGGIDALLKR